MTAIQPCALLLLVGPDWRVEAVSANVAMLGEHQPDALLGQPLADLIGSKAIHSLRNRLAWLSSDDSEVQDFGVDWGSVTLRYPRQPARATIYLIEAELAVEPRLPDGIGMVRSMMRPPGVPTNRSSSPPRRCASCMPSPASIG